MIKKAVFPDSFQMDDSPVALIGQYSRGLDKTAMVKRASAFTDDDLQFPRKKGYQYLHIITTGGLEKYGPNRNGDSYPYSITEYVVKHPKEGVDPVLHLDGGLKKYHNLEYQSKNAAVYKEHKTKKQNVEPSGYIVKAATNDNMCRGELIIGVDENKWARELQKKASGGNIYFSIGADVPHDFCGTCGNKARTREEYCDHAKHHLCDLTEDGDVIHVINDTPHFYDISGVAVPADRTAFALKSIKDGHTKTASLGAPLIPASFGLPVSSKIAAALKLSKLEKEVPAEVTDDLEDACCDEEAEDRLVEKLKKYRADEVLDALNRKGIMVRPKALYEILASDTDDPEAITDITNDIKIDPEQVFFNTDDENCPFCKELMDSSYDMEVVPDLGLLGMIEPFLKDLQLSPEGVKDRVIKVTLIKKASRQELVRKEASDYVSMDYAKYASSFVARNPDKALYALAKVRAYSK